MILVQKMLNKNIFKSEIKAFGAGLCVYVPKSNMVCDGLKKGDVV